MACLLGGNRDIFFPKLDEKEHLVTFAEIAFTFIIGAFSVLFILVLIEGI
jgi:hypothetical protein